MAMTFAAHADDCASPPPLPQQCTEGSISNRTVESFTSLSADEVTAIVHAASASLNIDTMTIAVVDRAGRVLALFRKSSADPANDDVAVGLARPGAFFSNNQAPLSSRTIRFLSGIHFPPGIVNAPNAALYGIENTNRGCNLNIDFNDGKCFPPARSVSGGRCDPFDCSGCGTGIVTGKHQPDDPDPSAVSSGGIPLYRAGKLVGGIGVVGSSDDEYAAVTGAFGAASPLPQYPLPFPENVFIEGVRLPLLGDDKKLAFDSNGDPIALQRPEGSAPGTADGTFVIGPLSGGCAPNEYLSGPRPGALLSAADVDAIVRRAVSASKRTRAMIRLPLNSYVRMVIAVADVDGSILALYRMPDATMFSIDVSVAKARNVVYFSSSDDLPGVPHGTAVTNRTIGFGAQPLFPPGIDSSRSGPFFSLFTRDLATPCRQGSAPPNADQNGIVFFPGSSPLFRDGKLAGGLGISGDGVEQDDYVTALAAGDFLPPRDIWADRIRIDTVRLPMFKYPRHPEGVTECGGKACN